MPGKKSEAAVEGSEKKTTKKRKRCEPRRFPASQDNQTIQNQIAYVGLQRAVRSETPAGDPAAADSPPACFESWFEFTWWVMFSFVAGTGTESKGRMRNTQDRAHG